MSKKIILASAMALVVAFSTLAFADALPPYIGGSGGLVNTNTINWNGAGNVWGSTQHVGVSQTTFDTLGDLVNGQYHTEVWNTTAVGSDFDLMGVRFNGNVTAGLGGGYVEVTQDRYGPSPVWYGGVAPGGESAFSRIELWDGTALLDMTTTTGGNVSGTLGENNLGRAPGNANAEFRVNTNVVTGSYNMWNDRIAGDGDRLEIYAGGYGQANLESLVTNMTPGKAQGGLALYPKGYSFMGLSGGGTFNISGYGHAQVDKEFFTVAGAPIAFSTTGANPIVFDGTGIHNTGDGVTLDSANLNLYTPVPWAGSFTLSNWGMAAQ